MSSSSITETAFSYVKCNFSNDKKIFINIKTLCFLKKIKKEKIMKNLSIDENTAWTNYILLKTLPPQTKICVLKNNALQLDNRWLKGARRYITGDSRNDLDIPLRLTFAMVASKVPASELKEVILHIQKMLSETYDELFLTETFNDLLKDYQPIAIELAEIPIEYTPTTGMNNVVLIDTPSPQLQQQTITHRNVVPPDVRINFGFDLSYQEIDETNNNHHHCIYEVFPCLKSVTKWFKDL